VSCGFYNSADVGSDLLGCDAVFIGKLFLITLFLDPLDPEDECSKLLQNVNTGLVSYPRAVIPNRGSVVPWDNANTS